MSNISNNLIIWEITKYDFCPTALQTHSSRSNFLMLEMINDWSVLVFYPLVSSDHSGWTARPEESSRCADPSLRHDSCPVQGQPLHQHWPQESRPRGEKKAQSAWNLVLTILGPATKQHVRWTLLQRSWVKWSQTPCWINFSIFHRESSFPFTSPDWYTHKSVPLYFKLTINSSLTHPVHHWAIFLLTPCLHSQY